MSEWLLQFDKEKSDIAPVYVFKGRNPQKYLKTQFTFLRKNTACKSQKVSEQYVSNKHW
jgi:hypothetical protein